MRHRLRKCKYSRRITRCSSLALLERRLIKYGSGAACLSVTIPKLLWDLSISSSLRKQHLRRGWWDITQIIRNSLTKGPDSEVTTKLHTNPTEAIFISVTRIHWITVPIRNTISHPAKPIRVALSALTTRSICPQAAAVVNVVALVERDVWFAETIDTDFCCWTLCLVISASIPMMG
jgi:hypothetical protein